MLRVRRYNMNDLPAQVSGVTPPGPVFGDLRLKAPRLPRTPNPKINGPPQNGPQNGSNQNGNGGPGPGSQVMSHYTVTELRKVKQSLDSIADTALTWRDIAGLTHSDLAVVNVRDFGAKGDAVTNDTAAIQAAINYVQTHYSSGTVLIPNGDYIIRAPGLTVPAFVRLEGQSKFTAFLDSFAADVTVLTFQSQSNGMANLGVLGYNNPGVTKPAVTLNAGVVGTDFSNCVINYGLQGVFVSTGASDNVFYQCSIFGIEGSVKSTGANWYLRTAFNNAIAGSTYGFYQVAAAGSPQENILTNCDFSGVFTYGALIDDPQSLATFAGCTLAGQILINQAFIGTMFSHSKFGGGAITVTATGGAIVVTGSIALAAVVIGVTPPATKVLAGNVNIT